MRDGDSNAEVFFQVGEKLTTVTGKTYLLKDDLPKLGAKWDAKARVWTMPAARTHEFLEVCEGKNVNAVEVSDEKRAATESLF